MALEWDQLVETIQDKTGQWLIRQDGQQHVLWDCFSARERMRGTLEECQQFAERHTKKPTKMEGVQVGESDVAKGLGFKDVYDFRRWQTEVGKENAELKHALSQAQDEARRFRWNGMRSNAILTRVKTFLEGVKAAIDAEDSRQLRESVGWYGDDDHDPLHLKKLLLAVRVVTGGSGADSVDWKHELADWLDYLNPLRIKIEAEDCTVTGILDGSPEAQKECQRTLAQYTGSRLIVTADHVGLVGDGVKTGLDNVPKTCRVRYKASQLGQNVYYGSDNPYETADFENPEEWGLEPPLKLPQYSCMVEPPPEKR